ncbi:MAG: transmembrane 220 family protein [Reichenbachiella sp.]
MKIKAFSIFYFLIFASFAFVQFNDPDPLFWVLLYSLVALVSFARLFGYSSSIVFIVLTFTLVGTSLFYFAGFMEYLTQPNKHEIIGDMVYKKPYIEQTREFLGLLLAAGSTFHQFKMK